MTEMIKKARSSGGRRFSRRKTVAVISIAMMSLAQRNNSLGSRLTLGGRHAERSLEVVVNAWMGIRSPTIRSAPFASPSKKKSHPSFSLSVGIKRGGCSSTSTSLFSVLATLDPHDTALVLIEFQNDFTTPGGKLHEAVMECMASTHMLENSRQLVHAAREAGCRIVHCPIEFAPGHAEIADHPYGILQGVKESAAFTAGSWGAQICAELRPDLSRDFVVKGKSGLCGFQSTNLDFLLSQHRIHHVILAGFLTNCCVESTMRTAYEKGYRVYTVKDGMSATSLAAHEATLQHNFGMFSIVATAAELVAALPTTTVL